MSSSDMINLTANGDVRSKLDDQLGWERASPRILIDIAPNGGNRGDRLKRINHGRSTNITRMDNESRLSQGVQGLRPKQAVRV